MKKMLLLLFGLAAVGLTYLVGRLSRMRSNLAMVLAGVMVGSLFSAGTSFIKLVADTNEQLPAITYWLMGALTAVRLDDLHFAMDPILLGLIPLFFLRWRLNLLTISEAEARSMGVNIRAFRAALILLSSVLSACVAAFAGPISFVGIAVPQLMKGLFGTAKPLVQVPACFAGGAVFCLFCDLAARTVFAPTELSISSVTAILGAPIVIFIMVRRRTRTL